MLRSAPLQPRNNSASFRKAFLSPMEMSVSPGVMTSFGVEGNQGHVQGVTFSISIEAMLPQP